MKVFIFGGTTEGRVLARTLSEAGHDITVSVATEIGREELLRDSWISSKFTSAESVSAVSASAESASAKFNAAESASVEFVSAESTSSELTSAESASLKRQNRNQSFRILTGRMDSRKMQSEIGGFDICIDATHPYAVEVTSNIRKACEMAGIEYVRLLRDEDSNIHRTDGTFRPVTEVPTACAACHLLLNTEGNILLTTGSKELGTFAEIPRERLFVRVLPTQASLAACEEAGIPHRNIIAMFGPFTRKMNEAMLEQYHIAHLVTKEAGKNGGFEEKLRAAGNCGVETIVIRRPKESGMSMSEVIDLTGRKAEPEKV